MAVLDDMDRKLDRLLDTLTDELNMYPPSMLETYNVVQLHVMKDSSLSPQLRYQTVKRDNGMWLIFTFIDPMGNPIWHKELRCVARDWITQEIIP